jgi:hypothetical protein
MAQVRSARLIGDTKTISTSRSFTFSLAFSACRVPF